MLVLDGSIANVALPIIAGDLPAPGSRGASLNRRGRALHLHDVINRHHVLVKIGHDPERSAHQEIDDQNAAGQRQASRQHHLAYLSRITESAIGLPAQRAGFWREVAQQLDSLANRISKADRAL